MTGHTACKECGETYVHALGLCRKCLDKKRRADREARMAAGDIPEPVRPSRINIGLKTCVVCGVKAASVRGMCVHCYKKDLYHKKKVSAEAGETLK